jgi:hypothetical protein
MKLPPESQIGLDLLTHELWSLVIDDNTSYAYFLKQLCVAGRAPDVLVKRGGGGEDLESILWISFGRNLQKSQLLV